MGMVRTEGYAVCFMLPAFYLFIRYFIYVGKCDIELKNGTVNFNDSIKGSFKSKYWFSICEMFLIGIFASLNLMFNIKSVILFVPFAIAVTYILIKHKLYKNLFFDFIFGLLGVIIAILPYLIYMITTGSYEDMFYAVFHINFVYANPVSPVTNGIKRNIFELIGRYFEIHYSILILIIISKKLKSKI